MKIKNLLDRAKTQNESLTFDDVTLQTRYSKILPKDVSLESKFSKNIRLKIPLVSAAMDTVTEREMAIEMAILGGLGIIHKNLSIKQQAEEVAKVKHHLSGLIEKPISFYENESISTVLQKKHEKSYTFHSFPVINKNNRLTGIVTRTDFEFCNDASILIKNIMTCNPLTASPIISINEAHVIMQKNKKKFLPLVNRKREIIGMYTFKDVNRIITGASEDYNLDKKGRLLVGAAIGIGKETNPRVEALLEKNVDILVIDTAHADTKLVIETLKDLKNKNYGIDIVVGNISNPDSVKRLIEAGADGIKVGQGPGSICTTRVITGVGIPQISAIYECVEVADNYSIPICADGGLRYSGDIVKAISAGAHSIMIGSMLAGTKQAPGNLILSHGRQWKSYRGMGSLEAMKEHKSSRDRYLQEGTDKLIPEGIEGLVPYKGDLSEIISQYVGGLRSGMGYIGAESILELRDKGDFKKVSIAGFKESHPHNVQINKDAPNYPLE